ncbi:uncharacterized protein N7483_012589 [Penicillium malachiteum]|uniref:uncharacterized protein n=1 Tax=Penicillium malachiteum TaxID=1324776 RepID=UPI002546821F|nr:uncharacterized protein N7483_012589 [Penicillium malachiteum]KAJ5715408.1 hypothetical protein N7483_012589 [Penicillium malachiteum]
MFRSTSRSFVSFYRTRSTPIARYFHRVTTDFVTHDTRGNLITKKVPVIIGNPGEAYLLIDTGVGSELRAASPDESVSPTSGAYERCKLTFFHDSLYFAFGSLSYPGLYVPNQIPRQKESNTSPATLFLSGFLSGKMHEIVLDGTPDAEFAEMARATGQDLAGPLEQLKDMRYMRSVAFSSKSGLGIVSS